MRRIFAMTCTIVLLCLGADASGGTPEWPPAPLMPNGLPLTAPENLPPRPSKDPAWRRMTNFGADTDSTCIGNPKSILCAVDALYGCSLFHEVDVCNIVAPSRRPWFFGADPSPEIRDYRLVHVGKYRDGDFSDTLSGALRLRVPERKYRKHTRVVIVWERSCKTGWYRASPWYCDDDDPHVRIFYLVPYRGRWIVSDWRPIPLSAAMSDAVGRRSDKARWRGKSLATLLCDTEWLETICPYRYPFSESE
jgi:hypothetical protein